MVTTMAKKIVIGRAELLHFLDLAIADLPAKIDTGAYRSAVHVDGVNLSDRGKTLTFSLLGKHPVFGKLAKTVTTNKFSRVKITNSFGHEEERYEVKLHVELGGRKIKTTFSLADRSANTYPILIGRKLLNNNFIVDTSKTSVNRRALKKRYNITLINDYDTKE
jgi:hypothetical protein